MSYFAFGRSGSTYRPRSSVTTIFANFVGRSDVSAITHTPASGPFAPVTTPSMSSLSLVVASLARPVVQAAQSAADATIATVSPVRYLIVLFSRATTVGRDRSAERAN